MHDWLSLFRDTFRSWKRHKAPKKGAALAYYTAFSLAPLVVLLLAIVSIFYERDAARAGLIAETGRFMGNQGTEVIDGILKEGANNGKNWWSAAVGFVVVLFGASGVFSELQDSLNEVWEIREREGSTFRNKLKDRLISFSMILGIGFLLLSSLILSSCISAAGKFLPAFKGSEFMWQMGDTVVALAATTLLFAAIFKVLPDTRVVWSDVWKGALITSVLFTIGKVLLGFYLGRSAVGSSYGAAGSLIVVLAWVYYSAQILFFGAEFTQVYARRNGSHAPADRARPQSI